MGLVQRLSQLVVHRLSGLELPASRVVNANHAQGPHETDQHGVVIRFGGVGNDALAYPTPPWMRPGNPKMIDFVGLGFTLEQDDVAPAIAHETFHSLNVWHHGEGDKRANWIPRSGFLFEESAGAVSQINVWLEPAGPLVLTSQFVNGGVVTPVFLGVTGGQHSGDADCLMRYAVATAYAKKEDASIRYWVTEQNGLSLCQSATGTKVNDAARAPQSRYGDAAMNRGSCLGQILVNDAVSAPAR
jgi:hypothetical protein